MKWQPVSAAPTDGREVLAAFPKQFGGWVVFIAHCTKHNGVFASNHAKPTVFAEIEYPNDQFMGIKLVTNDAIPAGEIHAISGGKCVAKVVGVDQCAAHDSGCRYKNNGPNGERQCEYCGEAP